MNIAQPNIAPPSDVITYPHLVLSRTLDDSGYDVDLTLEVGVKYRVLIDDGVGSLSPALQGIDDNPRDTAPYYSVKDGAGRLLAYRPLTRGAEFQLRRDPHIIFKIHTTNIRELTKYYDIIIDPVRAPAVMATVNSATVHARSVGLVIGDYRSPICRYLRNYVDQQINTGSLILYDTEGEVTSISSIVRRTGVVPTVIVYLWSDRRLGIDISNINARKVILANIIKESEMFVKVVREYRINAVMYINPSDAIAEVERGGVTCVRLPLTAYVNREAGAYAGAASAASAASAPVAPAPLLCWSNGAVSGLVRRVALLTREVIEVTVTDTPTNEEIEAARIIVIDTAVLSYQHIEAINAGAVIAGPVPRDAVWLRGNMIELVGDMADELLVKVILRRLDNVEWLRNKNAATRVLCRRHLMGGGRGCGVVQVSSPEITL